MAEREISARLHQRARAFVTAFSRGEPMPEPFEALACDLGRYQAAHIPAYARLCGDLDREGTVLAQQFPAVPTEVFKGMRLSTFDEAQTVRTFLTSGTTVGQRGRHDFRTLESYDTGALAFGRRSLLGDWPAATVLVLGPSEARAPESSLTHMNTLFAAQWGALEHPFFLDDELFDLARLDQQLAHAMVHNAPVLLLGTSFAFVHLLDALGEERLPLPPQSRVMHTGGFKGRSRELSPVELRTALASCFGVDERQIVQEYGMTELSSQFYERTAVDAEAPPGVFFEPPWAKVVPCDPETLAPVPEGEIGIARIEDLCNVDSVFAIQTADRVRRVHGGFELLGRLPGATPRGCSLATEELLSNHG